MRKFQEIVLVVALVVAIVSSTSLGAVHDHHWKSTRNLFQQDADFEHGRSNTFKQRFLHSDPDHLGGTFPMFCVLHSTFYTWPTA